MTATIIDVAKSDESITIVVVYKDSSERETTRKTMRFGSGAGRQQVEAEIQRVGNLLDSVASAAVDVEALRGTPIPIVPRPPAPPINPESVRRP